MPCHDRKPEPRIATPDSPIGFKVWELNGIENMETDRNSTGAKNINMFYFSGSCHGTSWNQMGRMDLSMFLLEVTVSKQILQELSTDSLVQVGRTLRSPGAATINTEAVWNIIASPVTFPAGLRSEFVFHFFGSEMVKKKTWSLNCWCVEDGSKCPEIHNLAMFAMFLET